MTYNVLPRDMCVVAERRAFRMNALMTNVTTIPPHILIIRSLIIRGLNPAQLHVPAAEMIASVLAAVMCVATTSYAGVPASITIVRHIAPPDLKPSEEEIKKKSC